jgi:hypothetical protein
MSESQVTNIDDLLEELQFNARFVSGFHNLEKDFPYLAKFVQSVPPGSGRHLLMDWVVASLYEEVSFPEQSSAKYFGFEWPSLKEEFSTARRNDMNSKFAESTLLGKKHGEEPVYANHEEMHIHTLYLKEMTNRHFCDVCQKDIFDGVMYRCDICDYDLCLDHS